MKLRFRSAVLSRLPRTLRHNTMRLLIFRLMLLAGILLGLATLVMIVHLRLLPVEDAPLLYRLHDEVYLPLVGHTFTRYFPFSVIWWGIALTALVWWMSMWLFQTSPLRFIQRRLLLRAIRQPRRHDSLLRWSRRFSRLRLRPHLLRLVAEDEWERVLRAEDMGSALSVLRLRIGLQSCFSSDVTRLLVLLEDWLRLAHLAYRHNSDQWADMHTLLAQLETLQTVGDIDAYFSPAALYGDARQLLAWLEAPARPNVELLQANDARRERLNTVYSTFHRSQSGADFSGKLPLPDVESTTWLPLCGRIALRLTLQVAELGRFPAHLHAYSQASERLLLLARATATPAARAWAALVGYADPQTAVHDGYVHLARLTATEQKRLRQTWHDQRHMDKRPILSPAYAETAHRLDVRGLLDAAHPTATEPGDSSR